MKALGKTIHFFMLLGSILAMEAPAHAVEGDPADLEVPCLTLPPEGPIVDLAKVSEQISEALLSKPESVFPTLPAAIVKKVSAVAPVKMIATGDAKIPEFPSYSACEKSFFRVATLNNNVDKSVSDSGWLSGWHRRLKELRERNAPEDDAMFDALPPSRSFVDRIIQYVRVKNRPSKFPKHSTVVGVMDNPVRVLSVGYHTGYDAGLRGDHLRMDEIEVGACARAPSCQKIAVEDTTEVFKERGLQPRYSTENEFAIDGAVPKECIVASYRISFQKVDDKCYSDANGNCGFGAK